MKKSEELKNKFINNAKKDHWQVSVTQLDDTITNIDIRTTTSIDIRTTMRGTKVLSVGFNDLFVLSPENNIEFGNGHHFILDATQVISLSKLMQQAVELLNKLDYLADNATLDTDVDRGKQDGED